MKIVVAGKEVRLIDREVKAAKRVAKTFLDNFKERCDKKGIPLFYYTFLLVLYLMVDDRIRTISPEILTKYCNVAYDREERRKLVRKVKEDK